MLQSRTGTSTVLGSVAIVNLIISLPRPTCFNCVLYLRFFSDLTPTTAPICHRLTLPHFSMFNPLLPTNSPGRGLSVHLDVSAPLWPPLLFPVLASHAVFNLLPRSLPAPGVPRRVPVNDMSFVRFPPIFHPCPVPSSLSEPRFSPLWWSLPLPFSVDLTSAPPPVGLNQCPIPWWSRGVFIVFFLYPCPLCILLTLHVFKPSPGFLWFLVSSLGFILRWIKRPGRLRYL